MMNFKHIFFCFLTAFLFSCSENDYSSYCPTWKGFTYKTGNYPNYVPGNPRNILLHPGDSIHITAHQKERGHLINATSYTWTIGYDTIDVKSGKRVHATKSYTQRTNYDGCIDGADDPVCHMLLPANALPTESGKPYSVTFVARYAYSGQGVTIETGNIVDNSSYSGTITPQSGPTAGGASGTLKFSVEENDYSSYCPTWKGFTYKTGNYPDYVPGNPRNILLHPGDSIHITAHQKERGHLINATSYTWTIGYDTIDVKSGERVHAAKSYTKRTNYDGYIDGADDPVCHMLLPANALPTEYGKPYSVTFVARYTYSGQGVTIETGNIVDNSSYSGTITPQSGPTAGGASGTLKFSVEEK